MSARQTCEITLDAYPGESFRGTIGSISPVVDPASRTMEVRVTVENRTRLKAGMFAKVRVITQSKTNIVKVPASAMVNRFGDSSVFVVTADPADANKRVAQRRTIVPGIVIDGVMEVQSGLRANEEIIIRGQSMLNDGSQVNVIEKVPPLSAAY